MNTAELWTTSAALAVQPLQRTIYKCHIRVSHGQCMYTASGNLTDSDVRGTHVPPRRLRRDYDGLAEQIRIASFSTQSYGKLTTEERM
jgi:hypothetical protein